MTIKHRQTPFRHIKHYYVDDINCNCLIDEALKEGYKLKVFSHEANLYSLRKGGKEKYFVVKSPPVGSMLSNRACVSKRVSKMLLKRARLNTPQGELVSAEKWDDCRKLAHKLGYPVVVKPNDRSCGMDVYVGLKNDKQLRTVINLMKKHYVMVMIEKYFQGKDLRLLSIDGKYVAAIERKAPRVIGDGQHNIKQLMASENRERAKNPICAKLLVNDVVKDYLRRQRVTLKTVPKKGQEILLKPSANVHGGGTSADATKLIHPEYKKILRRCYEALFRPPLLGMDVLTPDYTKHPRSAGYTAIEANSCPDFDFHHYPGEGEARNVARAILKLVFKKGN